MLRIDFMRALIVATVLVLASCSSAPKPIPPISDAATGGLPDTVAYYQKDPRWGSEELGHSGDTMASDGCLVTAASMALANLGFKTDPSDLNKRLTHHQSFTPRGWLIWSGISKVTGGQAKARFYDDVSPTLIRECMIDGFYPLVQFRLRNGRTHWAMIVNEDETGYRMRDPLRRSEKPLIFPHSAANFSALRCVGMA